MSIQENTSTLKTTKPTRVRLSKPSLVIDPPDDLDLYDKLREYHRHRQDLHRAEKSLTLQIRAKCRRSCGGDKKEAGVLYEALQKEDDSHPLYQNTFLACLPLIKAREVIKPDRKQAEKDMLRLVKGIPQPVLDWVDNTPGFGRLNLALILGETGDPSQYKTRNHLWKRLGVSQIADGTRQRKMSGDDAIKAGYSPSRHAVAWNLSMTVFRKQSGEYPGHYRLIYDRRKEYELQSPTLSKDHPVGHSHNRALRYMVQRLLGDLRTQFVIERNSVDD